MRPKILVAEDNPADVALLQRAAAKANIQAEFEFVSDGMQVLQHLREKAASGPEGGSPAVLMLDLTMPRMDGFEVLEWLRSEPRLRPRTVAVFSSSGGWNEIHRASLLGVNHYFVKPADPTDLVAMVKIIEQYCPQEPELLMARAQAEPIAHAAAA